MSGYLDPETLSSIAICHGADSRRHAVRLVALLIGIVCAPLLHANDRKIDPTFLYRDTSAVREKKSDITTKTCHYLAAAHRVPEAKAIVTIAAPSEPHYVVNKLLGEHLDTIAQLGEARVKLAGRDFNIRQHFVEDAGSQQLHEKIATPGRALLVMQAPQDDTVSMDNATRIFELAQHPKSFISLDGMDHLITRREDAAYVAGVISAWSARYLDAR